MSNQNQNPRPTRKRSPIWRAFRGDLSLKNGKRMNNVYTDPYMPDEEDLVEVGDLRPWGHEVHYKQGIDKKVLKQRAKENQRAEIEWMSKEKNKQHPNARDNRILCHKTSPWADCIEALEIYESKTP